MTLEDKVSEEPELSEEEKTLAKAKEIKNGLLNAIDHALANYGLPSQYYNGTNPDQGNVSKAIGYIKNVFKTIFQEKNEPVIKALYSLCADKEQQTASGYKTFYINLWDELDVWQHGEKIHYNTETTAIGEYTRLENKLVGAKTLLETGALPDLNKIYGKYAAELREKAYNNHDISYQ